MTPQNKLKRIISRILSGKAGRGSKSSSVATDEIRVEYPIHPELRRSQTDNMIIGKPRLDGGTERRDSLSQSYDDGYASRTSTDQSRRAARSFSLQPNRLSPLMSYREAVTCGSDCPCDCHKSERDQAYLTLCRCHMSGYESYRKAVYGGPRGLKKKHSLKHLDQEKRKSLPPTTKKFYGSADTLGSENSCDTIKATSSDYTNSSSGCKSSGSSGGAKSHNSSSPLSIQVSPQQATFRERELTLTHEHAATSRMSPHLPDPALTKGLNDISSGLLSSPNHEVGYCLT